MKRCIREPYRGRYTVYICYNVLVTLCIILLTCSVIKITSELQAMDKQLNTLTQQLEEMKSELEKSKEEIIEIEEKEEEVKELPKLYTEEDVIVLTKMLWGEARGVDTYKINGKCVSSKCQQAAVIWTALNRYDAGFEDTIVEVVTAKYQFTGYRKSNPVDDNLKNLVVDVLERWNSEKYGETDVGRVLPSDYMWFRGDSQYNYFRNDYEDKAIWTWELEDIYG